MTRITRAGLVLAVLSAVVIAAALSVSAAITVVEHRQSAEFWEQTADSIMGVGEIGEIRTESTTTVTQTSTHISGTGSEPSDPVELLSEGLWVVSVRFSDYEPPEVGNIPTVNLNSVSGSGNAGWSGNCGTTSTSPRTGTGGTTWTIGGWLPSRPARSCCISRTCPTT